MIPIYIRVSSEDQVQGTSLETQLRECRAAVLRDGYEVGEVFADEGESAKTIEGRPAFLRLLEHIKVHRPPAVMVWKIDRLARNNLDAQIVRSKLSSLNCRLISATEPISDDPSGKFMFDVLSAVAEYDNRLRAERCRLGMVAQAKEGWWVHGPPYGYKTARTEGNKPTLVPDPDRAPLVAEAFRMAAEGISQSEILTALAPEGLTMKSGKPMSKQTISILLANPVYAGNTKGRLAGEKTMKGKWQAIVSEEIWIKAQAFHRKGKVPRLAAGEFPYKGILVCGECGRRMTGSYSTGGSGNRHAYYHCPKCGLRARAVDVEAALQKKIDSLAMEKQAVDDLEEFVKKLMAGEFGPCRNAKEKLRKRVMGIEEQLDRLIQLHLTNGIDRKRYDVKRSDLEWRLGAARVEYDAADEKKVNLISEFHRARQFLLEPGVFWNTATTSERCNAFPLFFTEPLKMTVNKKVGTVSLDGSNCPIWYTQLDVFRTNPILLQSWFTLFSQRVA